MVQTNAKTTLSGISWLGLLLHAGTRRISGRILANNLRFGGSSSDSRTGFQENQTFRRP